jgi:hypothetical protein
MAERWTLKGQVLVACTGDWGSPSNFNARPTTGKCEGGWTWPVERGAFGGVTLDGLAFSVEVEGGPIRNPVNGAEQGDLGATTRFRVAGKVEYGP